MKADCKNNLFHCDRMCISYDVVCDFKVDCNDYSDESMSACEKKLNISIKRDYNN